MGVVPASVLVNDTKEASDLRAGQVQATGVIDYVLHEIIHAMPQHVHVMP